MGDRISEREYEQEIRSIAEELIGEAREGQWGVGESAREGISEAMWERIDGHSWVIYTYRAQQVVALSQNDGYAAEEWGADAIVQDGTLNWSAIAFGAMYADLQEELWRIDGFDLNDPNPEPEESDD